MRWIHSHINDLFLENEIHHSVGISLRWDVLPHITNPYVLCICQANLVPLCYSRRRPTRCSNKLHDLFLLPFLAVTCSSVPSVVQLDFEFFCLHVLLWLNGLESRVDRLFLYLGPLYSSFLYPFLFELVLFFFIVVTLQS